MAYRGQHYGILVEGPVHVSWLVDLDPPTLYASNPRHPRGVVTVTWPYGLIYFYYSSHKPR